MHAVIKIICFLIFASAMASGSPPVLLAGLLLVAAVYLFELVKGVSTQWRNALTMLKRLRWLFLSILVLYLFFTPGVLLWPELLWGPTQEGLQQGLVRIAVLVLIVAAVNALIGSTGQAEFLSAVSWCLQPLSWLGLSHERLAVRISLTLESVGVMRNAYRQQPRDSNMSSASEETSAFQFRLSTIADTAHRLFAKVIDDAEQAPLQAISLPEESHPPLVQWLIPVLLAVLLITTQQFLPGVG